MFVRNQSAARVEGGTKSPVTVFFVVCYVNNMYIYNKIFDCEYMRNKLELDTNR